MAESHVYVNLNLHGNQIKEFVVDNVTSFPTNPKIGRLISYHGSLWVYEADGWSVLRDDHLLYASRGDTVAKHLIDAIKAGEGLRFDVSTSPTQGGQMLMTNTITQVKDLTDVLWTNPTKDSLFGWDKKSGEFKPVHIGKGLEIIDSGGVKTIATKTEVTNPLTEHSLSVHGAVDANTTYHCMFVYENSGIYKKFAWFAAWCRTGQVVCNVYRVNTAGQSGLLVNHTVRSTPYELYTPSPINLAHGDRLEVRTGSIASNPEDLVITLGILTEYI